MLELPDQNDECNQEGEPDQEKVDERVNHIDQNSLLRLGKPFLDQKRGVVNFHDGKLADHDEDGDYKRHIGNGGHGVAQRQEQQGYSGEDTCHEIHHERRRRLLFGLPEQTVMQMILIAVHDSSRFGIQKLARAAPPDCQNHVEQRHTDRQNRQKKRSDSDHLVNGRKPDDGENQSEKGAAGVSQENTGGIKIVPQETETGSGKNQHADRLGIRPAHKNEPDCHAAGGNDRQSRRQSVQSVDQVECIDDHNHPDELEQERQITGNLPAENGIFLVAGVPDDQNHKELHQKFLPRFHFTAVIDQTESAKYDGGPEQAPEQRQDSL